MMIIIAPQTIDMYRNPRILRETRHTMRYHLAAQIPYLLTFEIEGDDREGAVREVHDGAGQRLIERAVGGAEASEASWRSKGGEKGAAEGETDVFGSVVVVDWETILAMINQHPAPSIQTIQDSLCKSP